MCNIMLFETPQYKRKESVQNLERRSDFSITAINEKLLHVLIRQSRDTTNEAYSLIKKLFSFLSLASTQKISLLFN